MRPWASNDSSKRSKLSVVAGVPPADATPTHSWKYSKILVGRDRRPRPSAVRRDTFIEYSVFQSTQLPWERHEEIPVFTGRFYGAWNDLFAEGYKQVAPNGAFNRR